MGVTYYPNLDLGGSTGLSLADQTGPTYDFTSFNDDKPSSEMDKWDFLNLFIEQIQNQDPLNPMDGYEFAAQLAQFSALEQQMQTNEWLETMSAYEQSINSAQSIALLGKEVTALGNLVVVEDGQPTPITYVLPEMGTVTVKIYDAEGNLVRTMEQGKEDEGLHTWTWNGLDDEGEEVPDGNYVFEVTATDDNDLPLEVGHICESIVSGIRYDDDGNPQILIGPQVDDLYDENGELIDPRVMVSLSDILEVAGVAVNTDTNSSKISTLLSRLKGQQSGSTTKQAVSG